MRCVGPERVAKRQETEKFGLPRDSNDRQSLRFQFLDTPFLSRQIHASAGEKSWAADHQLRIAEACLDTLTRNGLESPHLWQSNTALERLLHHGSRERVFRPGFDGASKRK
jgi:hypothetical protein